MVTVSFFYKRTVTASMCITSDDSRRKNMADFKMNKMWNLGQLIRSIQADHYADDFFYLLFGLDSMYLGVKLSGQIHAWCDGVSLLSTYSAKSSIHILITFWPPNLLALSWQHLLMVHLTVWQTNIHPTTPSSPISIPFIANSLFPFLLILKVCRNYLMK